MINHYLWEDYIVNQVGLDAKKKLYIFYMCNFFVDADGFEPPTLCL